MQHDRRAVSSAVTLGVLDVDDPLHQRPLSLTQMPPEPPADAAQVTPDHPMGHVVNVAKGCDLRVDPSAALFLAGEQGDPITRMCLRPFPADKADPNTAVLFALMASDISAPVTMNRGLFGWAQTVQLTTFLLRRPAPGWVRVKASVTVLGATYFDEDHVILDAAGQVVAQSRQLALVPKEQS